METAQAAIWDGFPRVKNEPVGTAILIYPTYIGGSTTRGAQYGKDVW